MGTLQGSLTQALLHPPPGMEDLQMLDARLAPLQPLLRALRLNPDGRLLVVCPRAKTLDDDVLDAERVTVWSEPGVYQGKQRMPPDTVAVVFTQMPGHRGTGHAVSQARAIGAQVWHATITPRTVRELCLAAGLITDEPAAAPAPPTPTPTPTPTHTMATHKAPRTDAPAAPDASAPARTTPGGKVRMGALSTFIRQQAKLDVPNVKPEIDRLVDLAATLHITTTRASIMECFYSMRRALRTAAGIPPSAQELAARQPRKRTAATTERKRKTTRERLMAAVAPAMAPVPDTPESVAVKAVHAGNVLREAMASVRLDGDTHVTDAAPAPAPVQPAPAAPVFTAVTSTTPPGVAPGTDAASLDADVASLLALADEAMAGLALMRDGLVAIRPKIASVFSSASEIASLRATLDRVALALTPGNTGEPTK